MHLTLQSRKHINISKSTDNIAEEVVEMRSIVEEYKVKDEEQRISIDELMDSLETLTMEHQEQRNQDADRVG